MISYLTWVMSAISLLTIFLSGYKIRSSWLITLGNQILWYIWILHIHAWGLLPLTTGITILAVRNWILWGRDDQETKPLAAKGDFWGRLGCLLGLHPPEGAQLLAAVRHPIYRVCIGELRCGRCGRHFWRGLR